METMHAANLIDLPISSASGLVPAGVANGFQALSDPCQYLYCFDAEWRPGMVGRLCNPLDPDLARFLRTLEAT